MTEKVNLTSEYSCNICNKTYLPQSSLCNRTKKFHKTNVTKNVTNYQNIQNVQIIKSLTCEICNKLFNSRSSKFSKILVFKAYLVSLKILVA